MTGIIVYYVVGPVHPRNAALLAREMPGWTFRLTYEPHVRWLTAESLAALPCEHVALADDGVPDALWEGDVRAVVFSALQPRRGPIGLLAAALERGLPTVAIEESNQIALNDSTVNNYLLPVDHLLVSSPGERAGMIAHGVPADRLEVTGWPFYSGTLGRPAPGHVRTAKERLGLNPGRPVATLTLTALGDAGESPAVRRQQLTLAAEGLPSEYQLVVKPHPIERLETLGPFVRACAPRGRVVDGATRIDDVLDATDVLLNRGRSQVCIEALHRGIPVVVLDTGVRTPFHGLANDVVVERPAELGELLARLADEDDLRRRYEAFRREHMPYAPAEGRALTCRRLIEIAGRGRPPTDAASTWLDLALYAAWQGDHTAALAMLTSERVGSASGPAEALRRLVRCAGTRADLEALEISMGPGFRVAVLHCLWIDQLQQRRERPDEADTARLADFPPRTNTPWFVPHARRWAEVLLRAGQAPVARAFTDRLATMFAHVPGVPELVEDIDLYQAGPAGRARYLWRRTVPPAQAALAAAVRRWRA